MAQSAHIDTCVAPTQVWARLATDRQVQVIQLMAQLAFNLIASQSDTSPTEVAHAYRANVAQDPA